MCIYIYMFVCMYSMYLTVWTTTLGTCVYCIVLMYSRDQKILTYDSVLLLYCQRMTVGDNKILRLHIVCSTHT